MLRAIVSPSGQPRPAAGELPVATFRDQAAWAAWLREHHAGSKGVWVKLAKGKPGALTYAQAVESALAWGWIDGQKRALDERFWLQKFTPRGRRSGWSKINRDKALALIAAGRMQPPGLAEVERAREDGRWDAAYDPPSRATIPDDLAAALAANPRAQAFFATVNAANRYAVLYRVQTARKPETRARRIVELVAMLGRGKLLHEGPR